MARGQPLARRHEHCRADAVDLAGRAARRRWPSPLGRPPPTTWTTITISAPTDKPGERVAKEAAIRTTRHPLR